jgi:hypothetical protein
VINLSSLKRNGISSLVRDVSKVLECGLFYFKYLPLREAAYSARNPAAIKAMAKQMGLPSGSILLIFGSRPSVV